MKDYSIQKTKNGKEYVNGKLMSGVTISFKAWGNSSAFTKLKTEAYENVPSYITATGDDFGGTMSLVVDSVQAVDGYTPDQFFAVKYNIDAYWEALKNLIATQVSSQGQALCNKVLFENAEVAERFKVEFAAASHHDNCKGGLLAHTYKVVALTRGVVTQYPALVTRDGQPQASLVDLLYIGALFHDLGKVREMEFGTYQPQSVVTHRYLGTEMIAEHKAEIVANYDEMWFYNLISMITEHHGEFGERCKSIYAQVLHWADCFDSNCTLLAQAVENVGANGTVKVDSNYLSL